MGLYVNYKFVYKRVIFATLLIQDSLKDGLCKHLIFVGLLRCLISIYLFECA